MECAWSVIAQRKKVSQCEHQGGAYQRNGKSNKGGKAPNEENAEEGGEEMRFASDAHCKVAYDERKSPKENGEVQARKCEDVTSSTLAIPQLRVAVQEFAVR